jgi:hypothetical protein
MMASKGKSFLFQHCWKLLEDTEKWRLWGHEAPPKKQASDILDASEHSDELKGRNKGKPDERKVEKGKTERKAEAQH